MAPDTMGAGKPDKRGTLVEPSGARLVSLLAPDQDDGALLLQPVVGLTRPGDIDRFTCTRTHRTVVDKYHDRDRTIREKAYPAPEDRYEEPGRVRSGAPTGLLSGTQAPGEHFARSRPLPEWVGRPEAAEILAEVSPPRHRQGFCVWFTGLSAAGKTTIANILTGLLLERGRAVTVLDGDVVRGHLSKGLGFSKNDRDENIRRIGFVAGEIVRHHGAVICAAVSPYEATRNECRCLVGPERFVLVYVATSLEVCEQRDPKGMYAKARRGEVKGFTGIDDPYEPPAHPDLVLTTTDCEPEESARRVLGLLLARGLVRLEPTR